MDDLMSKLSGILSDEESMKQLNELAKMLKDGMPEDDTHEKNCSGDNSPDIENMMKIMNLAGTLNNDDSNTQLLLALRPHLKEERQKKLDKALKILKMVAVYEAAKESGLLNNLF